MKIRDHLQFELSEEQWEALQHHFDILLRWNVQMNLTAIREPLEIVERHFKEALETSRYVPAGVKTVVDIGSGGGFPGLPLAICRPDLQVSLLDSHTRKSVFLREASRNVKNVKVMNQRLESTTQTFDLATARGVAWSHMFKFLPKVAPQLLLLSTSDEWTSIQANPQWTWEPPIRLESGDRRLILSGKCSTWNDAG